MIIKTIQLDEQQLANLNEFLMRAELKGREVSAFVAVSNAIFSNQEPVVMEKETPSIEGKYMGGKTKDAIVLKPKKKNGSKVKK